MATSKMTAQMPRQPEAELMDQPAEVQAYAAADFSGVNQAFVDRLVALAGNAEAARALDLGTGPGDVPIRLARAQLMASLIRRNPKTRFDIYHISYPYCEEAMMVSKYLFRTVTVMV